MGEHGAQRRCARAVQPADRHAGPARFARRPGARARAHAGDVRPSGPGDAAGRPRSHGGLRARRPHLAVVEDCGHLSTIEQPEAVTNELTRWLSTTGPEHARGPRTPRRPHAETNLHRQRSAPAALAAHGGLAGTGRAFRNAPLTLVVPSAPGGTTDFTARLIGRRAGARAGPAGDRGQQARRRRQHRQPVRRQGASPTATRCWWPTAATRWATRTCSPRRAGTR